MDYVKQNPLAIASIKVYFDSSLGVYAMPQLPSLANVTTTAKMRPFPMVTLYGQAGVGKTSLAAEFPRPILINIEGGVPAGVDIATTPGPPVRDFNEILAWLDLLADDEHDYKTLIIDSLDTLEKRVIHPHVKKKHGYDSIDQTFGAAYTRSSEEFEKVLERLETLRIHKRMFVVLTAAAIKESFDDLVNNSYHRFNLGLQRQLQSKIFHQSDFLFFMKPDVYMVKSETTKKERPASSSRRILCTSIMPMWVAKSRAQGLEPEIEYELGKGFEALRKPLTEFITGKAKLQEVQQPLQVSEGQTVAEARKESEDAERERQAAKAFAASVHAGTATVVPVRNATAVDPADDAGNNAIVEKQSSELSETLDDEIPF